MVRRIFVFSLAFVILFASGGVVFAGRQEVFNPVIDVSDLPIPRCKAAVKRAIQGRFPISEIREEQEDSFIFSFTIRKHSAKNRVRFSNTSIEFKFISCENLDFKVKDGKQLIHKNYNVWIERLEEDIKTELLKPEGYVETSAANSGELISAQPAGPDPGVMESDTHIHVFRQKSMVGAMMTVSAGINDQLIAQLKSSTYCTFKGKAGPITVNILQANTVIAAKAVDDRPGREVFLNYNYKQGSLTEISRERGLELLEKYKEVPNLTVPKPNPAYVVGLMNPGTFDDSLMKYTDVVLKPDADHAVITFVGDYEKFAAIPVGIWTVDRFLGSLNGRSVFQTKVSPGKHYFFGKYEHWAVLEADVEAGKSYFAQVTITRGMTQAHVRIIPVKRDTPQDTIDQWLGSFEKLIFDEAHLKDSIKIRMNLAYEFIDEALKNVENNLHETRILNASDSR